jgi:hypothetical protein
VASVIVGVDAESGSIENSSHLVIPSSMLTQAMCNLNYSPWVRHRPLIEDYFNAKVVLE